ncbi:hypothetical protein [Pseudoalteromonas fuliginea]|uniref:Uncharacterized protein n=1 Tax=Pseudoalteromonas fuliginea TaxID=1872678 RepID=A0ABQ6RNC9_9GAMM|nr:hypothetical protein [Pseudoalteromonas fuliginea]KAA1166165.1 hypothetical protein EU509_00515 [Pseudoalteromonas fuliginea]KAA1169897.1 hypothetical protein EUZ79_00480 [Pseudoalteromonas fuliginea]
MLKKLVFLLTVFMVFMVFNAKANHSCSGKVKDIQINKHGVLYSTFSGLASSAKLCDLSPAEGANDAEFCKALYSSLLVAKASDNTVTLWFNIDTNPSCSKGSWVDLYKDHGLYHFRLGS